jgi:hypothetical protein
LGELIESALASSIEIARDEWNWSIAQATRSGPLRFPRFSKLADNRAAKVVRVEIGVSLRGGEVGVAGQLLDVDGRCSVPKKLRHEEVPQIVKRPAFELGLRSTARPKA